jgi:predicted Zn-dependent protease
MNRNFRILFRSILTASIVLGLTACYTVPETGRRSLNILPEGQMMQMGLTEFQRMKQEVPISNDPAINAMVRKVGSRIARVAPLPNAQWEFVVFSSPEANAFCLPGGKVGIFTGILPITKDEAGLATVIGHEVAHAVAKHGNERVSRAMVSQAVGAVVAAGVSGTEYGPLITQAYGLGSQIGVELPHSRSQESEADRMGLIYMARAGYDPAAAVGFWTRFAQYNEASGSGTPWFLRTHPLDETRIEQIKEWLPEAKAQFRRQR